MLTANELKSKYRLWLSPVGLTFTLHYLVAVYKLRQLRYACAKMLIYSIKSVSLGARPRKPSRLGDTQN